MSTGGRSSRGDKLHGLEAGGSIARPLRDRLGSKRFRWVRPAGRPGHPVQLSSPTVARPVFGTQRSSVPTHAPARARDGPDQPRYRAQSPHWPAVSRASPTMSVLGRLAYTGSRTPAVVVVVPLALVPVVNGGAEHVRDHPVPVIARVLIHHRRPRAGVTHASHQLPGTRPRRRRTGRLPSGMPRVRGHRAPARARPEPSFSPL